MNPIVRMMKRYIKMPLKYALPLLFIGALVLASTTGCVDTPAMPTPTVKATVAASATPQATATPTVQESSQNDPLITAMINAYNKSKGGAQYLSWVKLGEPGLLGSASFGNDYDTSVQITRYSTVAKATEYYNGWFANSTDPEHKVLTPVAWGLDYYTAAAGHAPTVKSITTMYVGGVWKQTQTVAQYDDTVVVYAVDGDPNGSSS
jgi:hypothetical protein